MLTRESAELVRATLPVVGAAIEEIATRFYQGMFADNPELLRDLFNRGNQAAGTQRKALAGSIAAYAGMLVNGERPETLLSRIAHKHASLGIRPDQYDLVHKYLFAAIAEVLGDALTPEIAAAWDEVYWHMAESLIAVEADLYARAGREPLRATVVARHAETDEVVSLLLRPQGGPVHFRPGQYISVQVPLPDGARQIRQYSLSRAPERGDWRISVKRLPGGPTPAGEVSAWLHDHVVPGDTLTVSAPFGDLTLPPGEGPLLLASAGIGVTPILAMVDHLAATGSTRQVIVAHADRSPARHPHRAELAHLVAALPGAGLHLWYEEPGAGTGHRTGLMDLAGVELPANVTACLCGPLPFMRSVRAGLLDRGVPARDVHYEVFGPDLWLAGDRAAAG
ncbi:hemin transporter [Sphaerisporangium rufum]|uniref:nitric oxide dioxygenase n=1 Tax=Sphaerisporangium rufum TaxID=1381558 RepID=A0A919V0B9_9ACTN|nr:globin domain-containing protein [Sphaerisporangium rufum]GII79916.1 hemin transporter [Sphaerisporangium rufum]